MMIYDYAGFTRSDLDLPISRFLAKTQHLRHSARSRRIQKQKAKSAYNWRLIRDLPRHTRESGNLKIAKR
ncbi:MAG: hypothetical protein LBO72_10935 [Helicobacteraceae bacterium]|jgi:hypothetical protein|nr:hypothetical protein [Helicobacteraceae bacterium]